jgi:hypothetical protein
MVTLESWVLTLESLKLTLESCNYPGLVYAQLTPGVMELRSYECLLTLASRLSHFDAMEQASRVNLGNLSKPPGLQDQCAIKASLMRF